MTREQYDHLRRQIKEQYTRDLKALDRVWEIVKSLPQPVVPVLQYPPKPPVEREPRDYGTIVEESGGTESGPEHDSTESAVPKAKVLNLVREAIGNSFATGDFSSRDVVACIDAIHADEGIKRTSITSALNRLVELNELDLIEAGEGRRPSRFTVSTRF